MATLRASASIRTSCAARFATMAKQCIEIQPNPYNLGYRRPVHLSIQIAAGPYRFLRYIPVDDVFLEGLLQHFRYLLWLAVRAVHDDHLATNRAFARGR